MARLVEQAFEQKQAAHEVEHKLFRRVVEMGYKALGLFCELFGKGGPGWQRTTTGWFTVCPNRCQTDARNRP